MKLKRNALILPVLEAIGKTHAPNFTTSTLPPACISSRPYHLPAGYPNAPTPLLHLCYRYLLPPAKEPPLLSLVSRRAVQQRSEYQRPQPTLWPRLDNSLADKSTKLPLWRNATSKLVRAVAMGCQKSFSAHAKQRTLRGADKGLDCSANHVHHSDGESERLQSPNPAHCSKRGCRCSV